MTNKVTRWLYGVPNMVGCVGVLVGVGLFLAGVISGPLVPLVIGGLYVLGAAVTPRPKGISTSATAAGAVDPREIRQGLAEIQAQVANRLPGPLMVKVQQISQTVIDILPKVNDSAIDRQDLFALERTVAEYLPDTINNYLTLPRGYANKRIVANGKTAQDLLSDQLDLILTKMQAISEAVAKDDLSKLMAQGQFLQDKFGRNDELSIGAPGSSGSSGVSAASRR